MTTLAERVLAAAPRLYIDRAPAADPADRLAGNPAAAGWTTAAAGTNRREAPRLCLRHWTQLRGLVFDPKRPRDDDRRLMLAAQDALVGNAAFLAGDRAAELADDGCPVCFLNARSGASYDDLIAVVAHHVLGRAS